MVASQCNDLGWEADEVREKRVVSDGTPTKVLPAMPSMLIRSGLLSALKSAVLILTGGNIDPLAHSRVIERGLAADGRIYRFDVLLNDI